MTHQDRLITGAVQFFLLLGFVIILILPIIILSLPSVRQQLDWSQCIKDNPVLTCYPDSGQPVAYTQPQHETYADGTDDWISYPIYSGQEPRP